MKLKMEKRVSVEKRLTVSSGSLARSQSCADIYEPILQIVVLSILATMIYKTQ
jgi:hypothetical protein